MVYSNERISRAVVVALRITNKGIKLTVRVSLQMEFLNPLGFRWIKTPINVALRQVYTLKIHSFIVYCEIFLLYMYMKLF